MASKTVTCPNCFGQFKARGLTQHLMKCNKVYADVCKCNCDGCDFVTRSRFELVRHGRECHQRDLQSSVRRSIKPSYNFQRYDFIGVYVKRVFNALIVSSIYIYSST